MRANRKVPKLNEQDMLKLKTRANQTPFSIVLEAKTYIEKEFKVSFSEVNVWKILKKTELEF